MYTYGITKVGEVLYQHSQTRRDIEDGFGQLRDRTPRYIVKPLEIILPTIMAIRDKRIEIRWAREF